MERYKRKTKYIKEEIAPKKCDHKGGIKMNTVIIAALIFGIAAGLLSTNPKVVDVYLVAWAVTFASVKIGKIIWI